MSPASGMGRSEVETCLVNLYIYIYIYIYIARIVQESCVECSTWIGSFNESVKLSCCGKIVSLTYIYIYIYIYIYGQFHRDLWDKIRIFSALRTCSDYILSNKLWLYCPIPSIKDSLPSCKTFSLQHLLILRKRSVTYRTCSCKRFVT